jgi:hypothetical protein
MQNSYCDHRNVESVNQQGCRKHKKVGGAPVSRGTFGMKRAPKNPPPPRNVGDRAGGREKINAIINQIIFHKGKGHFATGKRNPQFLRPGKPALREKSLGKYLYL